MAQAVTGVRQKPCISQPNTHGIQPRRNLGDVTRGRANPPLQKPRALRCQRAVNRSQKRASARTLHRARQLKIAPRGRINLHNPSRHFAHGCCQKRQLPLLGDLQIIKHSPQRRNFSA